MDYIGPARLMEEVDAASTKKAALSIQSMLHKRFLAGALLAFATATVLGADIGATQWLFWNALPVTLGNIVGGAVLAGLLLHYCNASHSVSQSAPGKDRLIALPAMT